MADILDNTTEPKPDTTAEPKQDEPTIESLLAQVKALEAEKLTLKNSNDKLASENGNLRKDAKARMTAEEKEAEAKKEAEAQREEQYKALQRENEILKSTNHYLDMGFSRELAESTATAVVDRDQATVDANFAAWTAEREKAIETRVKEEYLKNMPAPNSGNNGGGGVDYAKQQADALAAGDMNAYVASVTGQWRASQET